MKAKEESAKSKTVDVIVLGVLLLLAAFYAYVTNGLFIGKPLFVGVIFTIPQIIYLGLRHSKNWKKIIVSTLVFGGIFGFLLDFLAEYNKAWSVVSLVFPYKILNVDPIDNVLGYMLMTALTVTFYEHFIDREKDHNISHNLKYAIWPGIVEIFLLVIIFYNRPSILLFRYPYFLMGCVAIIPTIILSFRHPSLIKKMATTAIYFFFFYLTFELFAVAYHYWIYVGNNYIGWVDLFGLRFPFEELFFWIMFYAASLVAYYEIFIDDEK